MLEKEQLCLFLLVWLIISTNNIYAHPGHWNITDFYYYDSTGKLVVNETIRYALQENASSNSFDMQRFIKENIIQYLGRDDWFSLTILIFFAFLLGVGHSLTPGHGKTVIVSYLVGERATKKDALVLGLSTAITHVIDVFLVMVIFMFILKSYYIKIFSYYISYVSTLLLFVIAVGRFNKSIKEMLHHIKHTFSIGHEHHEEHHYVQHNHEHIHADKPWLIGIINGLAPCPTAWMLFLLSLSLNKMNLGFILMVSFSIGIIITISTLAVIILKIKHGININTKFSVYLPVVGYGILTMLSFIMLLGYL